MPHAAKAAQKAVFENPFLRDRGQFTDVHNGFHLCCLQAGDEGLNGQAFVAEGEKGGVHGDSVKCLIRRPEFYAIGILRWCRHV